VKELVSQFIGEFQEKNPLSKLSVICTMREQAFMLSEFDKPKEHALQKVKSTEDFEGNPSY
jgi:hypothetical protein